MGLGRSPGLFRRPNQRLQVAHRVAPGERLPIGIALEHGHVVIDE